MWEVRDIPRQGGLSAGPILTVDDADSCGIVVVGLVLGPAPVGPQYEVVWSEFCGVGRGVDGRGEEGGGDSAVHVGFLVLVENDFSAELGDLRGWFFGGLQGLGWRW